jgi:serine/threonine protein kinase
MATQGSSSQDDHALNIASFSLSAIGLIALFDSCLRGCSFVTKAMGVGDRSQVNLSKFEIETWRLAIWGRMWGLVTETSSTASNHYLNIVDIRRIVGNCLIAIRHIVGDMEVLEERYGLKSEPDSSSSPNTPVPDAFGGVDSLNHAAIVEAYSKWLGDVAQRKKEFSLAKRVQFTFADEDKFQLLTQDLAHFVQRLYDMLPADKLKQYQRAYTAECLGRATSDQALSNTQNATSETLSRHAGNQLLARHAEVGTATGTVTNYQKKYRAQSLNISRADSQKLKPCMAKMALRSTTSPTAKPAAIYVEWKTGAWDDSLRGIIEKRIDNLAVLLGRVRGDGDDLYCSLDCIGYFEDPRPNVFGIIYRVPSYADPLREPLSLYERLEQRHRPPSLDVRFQIAKMLAVSVNELHASGWLHKGICSNNIVFFYSDGNDSSEDEVLEEENDEKMLSRPCLAGFEISRPQADNRGTEDKSAKDDPSDENCTLYRHPSQSWSSSRREHDIFSLGLVLLEIGSWQRLEDIKEEGQSISKFHAEILNYAQDLHADAGLAYREATIQCLTLASNVWTAAESLFPSVSGATVEQDQATAPQDENQLQGRVLRDFYFSVVEKLVSSTCTSRRTSTQQITQERWLNVSIRLIFRFEYLRDETMSSWRASSN